MTEIALNNKEETTSKSDAPPTRRTVRARRTTRVLAIRWFLVLAFLFFWELGAGDPTRGGALFDSFYFSQPSEIWQVLTGWVADGQLLVHLASTVTLTLIGFGLGAFSGMLLGFLLGTSRFWSDVFNPIIATLYAIPRLALIPLFLVWFGLGPGPKLAMVIVMVFFLVFYNTYSGVRDVDQGLIDVMRVMKATRWQIHTRVTMPSALVWIAAGLRVSVPYALVGTVTAEMLMSNSGMGYLIMKSSSQFNTAGVFAGIAVLAVLALVFTGIISMLEKRMLAWKDASRDFQ